ncbi:unnamed protein product [Prunus armeniaca]
MMQKHFEIQMLYKNRFGYKECLQSKHRFRCTNPPLCDQTLLVAQRFERRAVLSSLHFCATKVLRDEY